MNSTKLITVFILLISFTTVAQAQTQRSTFDWNGNTYDVINPTDVTLNENLRTRVVLMKPQTENYA